MAETNGKTPVNNVPDWLQAELFVDVLKETIPGFTKIKSFKASSGTAVGENFATVMLRVKIEVAVEGGRIKDVSYMIKLPHQNELFEKMMEHNNVFEAESNMYNIYIPELEQIYRDAGLEVKFGPQSYKLKGAKTDYILLEDLAPKGYKNMNRLEGLDQAHVEAALQKVAQWHAASVLRVAAKGSYPDHILKTIYKDENRPMMVGMYQKMSDNFIKSCATYNGNEAYIDQVKALQPKAIDGMFKMAEIDPSEFNVLNHGDFWSNNVMYAHDAFGKIKGTHLVDFQMCKYGTFAQDLYYLLISSSKFEDKLTKFDYYVRFYHENLVKSLKFLKYTKYTPTLRDIHLTLVKYNFLGYTTATGVMTAVLMDPSDHANLEMFLGDSKDGAEYKDLINTNPRYRKHIQIVLPWLLNRGALEL